MLAAAVALFAALLGGNVWRGGSAVDGPIAEGGWVGRTRAWFTARGVYPSELDPASGRSFAWTHGEGFFRIPVMDGEATHTVRLTVRGVGPAPGRVPQRLVLSVNGVTVQEAELTGQRQSFELTVPPSLTRNVFIGFSLSSTFVPGPQDRRQLGMIVDRISIAAAGGLRTPASALWPAVGAALALGLAVGLLTGSLGWALALAAAGGLAQGLLLALDAAFLGDVYVWRLLRIISPRSPSRSWCSSCPTRVAARSTPAGPSRFPPCWSCVRSASPSSRIPSRRLAIRSSTSTAPSWCSAAATSSRRSRRARSSSFPTRRACTSLPRRCGRCSRRRRST